MLETTSGRPGLWQGKVIRSPVRRDWGLQLLEESQSNSRRDPCAESLSTLQMPSFLGQYAYFNVTFFYCAITVVPIFLHYSPLPYLPPPSTFNLPPPFLSLSMSPSPMFLDDPSPSLSCYPPLPFPLVTICSLFTCLWLYFACSFVLLIRFHL